MKRYAYCLFFFLLFAGRFTSAQTKAVPQLGACASTDKAPLLKKYGYDFIQPTVAEVLQPELPDASYVNNAKIKTAAVPVTVVNVFIPGSIKTTGPKADETAVLRYATTVFKRAKAHDIRLIVFGSGASRNIPEGFDRRQAYDQFVSISKKLAALAARYDIVLALESQNKAECNFLNTLKECIQVAKDVAHPSFKITVDIYHMMRENEPASVIREGGKYIYHCDIGEKETRSAPGVAGDDFTPYFKALQDIDYKGKIALECRFKNMEAELPLAMKTIRQQWEAAGRHP